MLRCYREEYRSLASKLGIRLASEDNPSKAFPPSCVGEILGLVYNTEKWTWNMTEAKRVRLQVLVAKGIRQGTLLNEEAKVLAGKINHYSNIIGGKYERCLIIHIVDEAKKKDEVVVVGKQARVQLTWWLLNLRALSLEGNFIPNPQAWFPRTAVELFPDAAGGDSADREKGWGCCNPKTGEYITGVWPDYILQNVCRNGRTWGRRLTVLEGYGGAQALPAWVEAIVEAGAVALYIDNAGFVYAHRKGCSKDEWIYTLAKFIQASG